MSKETEDLLVVFLLGFCAGVLLLTAIMVGVRAA